MIRRGYLTAVVVPLGMSAAAAAPVATCPADINADGRVEARDYREFLACLVAPPAIPSCAAADADGSGTVDLRDFAAFQAAFDQCHVCPPEWTPGFNRPGLDGYDGPMAVFDDGTGPALYVAGRFTTAGPVVTPNIARWDGHGWSAVGPGLPGSVTELAAIDSGENAGLYAVSWVYTQTGESWLMDRWNGNTWTRLSSMEVDHLIAYDDGTGATLFAVSNLCTGGTPSGWSVCRWDGTEWVAVTGTLTRFVYALAIFDEGTGPAFYVGVTAPAILGPPNRIVLKWDGNSWVDVGSGAAPQDVGRVNQLLVLDDGSGPALYAAGSFASIDGVGTNSVARWDGHAWSAVGSASESDTLGGTVVATAVFDDGAGPALYASWEYRTSSFHTRYGVARLDGSTWVRLGYFLYGGPNRLQPFHDKTGPALYARGLFYGVGDLEADKIVKWDGRQWSLLLDSATNYVGYEPVAFATFDDGSGPALYAGGSFEFAGGVRVNHVAKWDGAGWRALGNGTAEHVSDLETFDRPEPLLIAIGGTSLSPRQGWMNTWNGTEWTLAAMANDYMTSLAVFDDGRGDAVYVGGRFSSVDGVPAKTVARWDGFGWEPVGNPPGPEALTLVVVDVGKGPALYAALWDAAGDGRIAAWDGTEWTIIEELGNSGGVSTLIGFNDGRGEALYAIGGFSAGDVAWEGIARWDGVAWESLGGGLQTLPLDHSDWIHFGPAAVFDDGTGPGLYVAGHYYDAGGVPVRHLARWDGVAWSSPAGGVETKYLIPPGEHWGYPRTTALAGFDDGSGPALFVGGSFTRAGGVDGLPSYNVAKLSVPAGPCRR
ncbi:MAG: hypothetical protein HY763_11930 [Planctomycetes bacterium]|nr:hypothetical protein [Planctomycetota bacterium]